MTTRLVSWIIAGTVLTIAGVQVLCAAHPARATATITSTATGTQAPVVAPEASTVLDLPPAVVVSAPVRPSRRGWCEPLELQHCTGRGATCSPMPDGTRRRCQHQWLRPHSDEYVCAPTVPSRAIQTWRLGRLRQIADAICTRKDRCSPGALTKYLGVLSMRETSRRPWKRHRLSEDIDAATTAWGRRSDVFSESPAHAEPWRWLGGLGYYGQNPALWLDVWDSSAEPETLCGETESTLVHLRGARRRHALLERGVECAGADFHGTSHDGTASWYDISLVNSGHNACPATHGDGDALDKRQSFERRCARVGLDPYASVRRSMLGAPVDKSVQDHFAAGLRERLNAAPI